jgi:hypothetical protein
MPGQRFAVISTPDNHFAAVLRCGGGAEQDLVIEDEVLLLRFLKRALKGLGEAFEVFIAHAVFGFDHGDVPDRAFGIRRIALCRAQACDAERLNFALEGKSP